MRLPDIKTKKHKSKTTKKSAELADFFYLSDNIRCRFIKDDVALPVIFGTCLVFSLCGENLLLAKSLTLSEIAFARAFLTL